MCSKLLNYFITLDLLEETEHTGMMQWTCSLTKNSNIISGELNISNINIK